MARSAAKAPDYGTGGGRGTETVGRRSGVSGIVGVLTDRVVDKEHLVEWGGVERGQELGERYADQPHAPPAGASQRPRKRFRYVCPLPCGRLFIGSTAPSRNLWATSVRRSPWFRA